MKSSAKKVLSTKKLLELQQAKDYLDNIIDTSLDSIVISDPFGYITRANESFLKLRGYKEEDIIGKHIVEFSVTKEGTYETTSGELIEIDKTFIDTAKDAIYKNLFEKGKVSNWETYIFHKNGKVIVAEENIVLMYNKEGEVNGAFGIIRDITDKAKAEREIIESKQFLENIFKTSVDGILVTDKKGVIVMVNNALEKMLGYPQGKLIGKHSRMLVPSGKEYEEEGLEFVKLLHEKGTIMNRERICVRKDGSLVTIEQSAAFLKDNEGVLTGSISSIRDITARKQAERKLIDYQSQLKALTSQIILSEEKERRRFAEYLHNEIGQHLFASRIQLEQLNNSFTSTKHAKTLDNVLNNIKQMIKNSRSLTFELSSPILYELGFERALEWLAEHTYKQYNIVVDFEDDKQEKPLDDNIEIFLYQAVRELLTNVAKHAQTENAILSIKKDNSNIRICVKDNGVGFNTSNKHSSDAEIEGFGLFRIKERLEQFGGQLEIESQPNHGTQITLLVPLSSSF